MIGSDEAEVDLLVEREGESITEIVDQTLAVDTEIEASAEEIAWVETLDQGDLSAWLILNAIDAAKWGTRQ